MSTAYLRRIGIVSIALAASLVLAGSPHFAVASDTGCTGGSCTVVSPLKGVANFPALIKAVLNGILVVATPIIVLFIVYSGFLFVTARGDLTAIQKARDNLLWVVIGSVVLLGAWAIAQIIASTLQSVTGTT